MIYFEKQLSTVEVLSHFGNYNDILQLAEIINDDKNEAFKKIDLNLRTKINLIFLEIGQIFLKIRDRKS